MYSNLQLAGKYIRYILSSLNGKGHGMHSPFVFQFILHVLNNRSGYEAPATVEALRTELQHDQRLLDIEDFGAGSRTAARKKRHVAELAKTALKPKRYAQLLFRLVKHYRPQTVLELGTSLGVTTAYLASANPAASVTTIEGSEAIAAVAGENFAKLGLKNVRQRVGNFDNVLPSLLAETRSLDLVYIDGNHRFEPTLAYFQQVLPLVHNDSILVFDDIHWSAEMEKAWAAIRQHPAVHCTVDIFFLGFVFFRNEFKEKQHFTIRF
ncbi:O-methyltransferase [Flavisolibacter nicotianae]|uniref:O-methyltransferase n=1 Tax=Flavisolibacter nicotianae TaxID=2364882 RepID=UPI000EAC555B|nr:class I SAM-dependent methyltransferase [Flavisolibacter nicotianae]